MSQAAARHWSVEEFLAWQLGRPGRFELVGGFPVELMSGATIRHDDIVLNILAELRQRQRGKSCRPFTADLCIETLPGQIRRPDAGVDCGPRDPDGLIASDPVLVVEVFSPTTRDFDTAGKLTEYKAVASLRTILYVEPNRPEVFVFERNEDGEWIESRLAGMETAALVPVLGIELPLAEIFDGVEFPTGPYLA
ncbi:Uma2 family endonuclease [Aurantimonas sp. C2-6-R+9]|uniref:Uma2 family endonuclease n=1 Tax=unclassified Aurantimonas TaxID=2638230 RepID=UPI002E17BAD1|nr:MULTISPECIES: Uma2 family endonuclease [unclassified Aurantimonas]MEC5291083.1 Uma2 family endonuclease [Aurantimonas sp. C2-3-R2]MEC5381411.1 Uma2 family endonuclease [Aurantimonas sp. C2-6-R+9]MEC5412234.1 Uma2 family endonuclease [Aurantimonas sp. C2-4-R8]